MTVSTQFHELQLACPRAEPLAIVDERCDWTDYGVMCGRVLWAFGFAILVSSEAESRSSL
jgi:hypothetical protein